MYSNPTLSLIYPRFLAPPTPIADAPLWFAASRDRHHFLLTGATNVWNLMRIATNRSPFPTGEVYSELQSNSYLQLSSLQWISLPSMKPSRGMVCCGHAGTL